MSTAPNDATADSDAAACLPAPLVHPHRSQKEFDFFYRVAVGMLMFSCAVAFTFNLVDPDLWGHVKYGQEVIADGHLHRTATHTYTTPDYRWINHENIAELTFAWGYELFGSGGLLAAKCILGMLILWLMATAARRRSIGPLATWAILLLVAINLSAFFPVRPQLLSFACCAVLLFLLDRAFAEWPVKLQPQFKYLWCIPLVMLVWVNAHGGFVAGYCILLAYLGGRSVEMYWRQGPDAWPAIRGMAFCGLVACLAAVANPYGIRLPLWLAESLGEPRPEITEWAPPQFADPVFMPFTLLCLLAIASIFLDRRRRDWTHIVILALVGWQAASHVRHVAFFALLCGFWLPPQINGLITRFRNSQPTELPDIVLAPWLRRGLVGAVAVIFFLQTFAIAARINVFPVYRHMYPVDAFAFMQRQEMQGKLVVAFNWAQYAIAALAPDVEVQFDGRFRTCYPQEMVDMHFDFLLGGHGGQRHRSEKSGPIDGARSLEFKQPDLVLVDRSYQNAVDVMEEAMESDDAEWVLLYQDGIAQLYGRASRYDDPASPHYLPPKERVQHDHTFKDYVPWPALPQPALDRFTFR